MQTETPTLTQSSAALARSIYQSPELLKQAADLSTWFVREKVREGGFARKMTEPTFVTSADLDRTVESDQPAIILEKDMEAKAMTMPFRGQGENKYWEGEKVLATFQKLESTRFDKSKFEMMNSKTDYKTLLQKRIVEEMYTAEDKTYVDGLNNIITNAEAEASGRQYQEVSGGLSKTNLKILMQMLSKLRMIPTEGQKPKVLMTKTLKLELIELGMIDIGDSNVSKNWNDGVNAIPTIMGFPVVETIKNDIVTDDEVFLVAPQEYFNRFFILQDHTLVIKTEADMINFYSYGSFSMTFVNVKGVTKIKLT